MSHLSNENKLAPFENFADNLFNRCRGFIPFVARICILMVFLWHVYQLVFYFSNFCLYFQWTLNANAAVAKVISVCLLIPEIVACSLVLLRHRFATVACVFLAFVLLGEAALVSLNHPRYSSLCRDFGTLGGLLMIVAELYFHDSSNKISGSTSILETSEHEQKHQKKSCLLLIGRVLMLFMYLPKVLVPTLEARTFFTITKSPSFIVESVVGVFLIICVVLGYKTKLASLSLIIWLAFWTLFGRTPPWIIQWDQILRDSYTHQVLQTLSTIGGLLMLGQIGAGTLSVDARKKRL